jgi:hypothetical protein
MRLGRLSPGPTPHLPDITRYTARAPLPEPPDDINWTIGTDWPLLANDIVGDCTCAAVLHYIQSAERWHDGTARPPTDAQALYAYSAISDYPATDTGALISDVLTHWHTTGFEAPSGHDTIHATLRLDPANTLQLRQALWLFGPLILGARLPLAAQTQARWTTPTDLTDANEPGTWGGHCVLLTGWHADGTIDIITWGQVKPTEPGWLTAYADEAWAVLHPTWIATGKSPSGWLAEAVIADMQVLT